MLSERGLGVPKIPGSPKIYDTGLIDEATLHFTFSLCHIVIQPFNSLCAVTFLLKPNLMV